MRDLFEEYFLSLSQTYAGADHATEHSGRTALENLLNGLKPNLSHIQHEPGRQGDKGAPDFKIMRGAQILGYVENKAPGVDLSKVLKSDQIKRYTALSDNLIICNGYGCAKAR